MFHEPLRFALIGCGRIAPKHAESFLALNEENELGARGRLVAVCDTVPELSEAFARKYRVDEPLKVFANYREVLACEDVDAVSIATPSGIHAEIGIAAARAGKHVLVEKPMAMTLEQADALIEACREADVKLGVIHQNRFNASVKILRQALEAGRFGKLTHGQASIRWNRNDGYYLQAPWRGTREQDGGVLMNQSIHNIDLLQWMFGPVDTVFGFTRRAMRPIEMEDVGAAVLKFANGAIGVIEAASTIYPKNIEETLNVFGTEGSVIVGGIAVNRIETWEFADSEEEKQRIFAAQEADPPSVYGYGHRELIADFVRSVWKNQTPAVCGEEGRKALEIILAIYQCQETGEAVHLTA
ncbi:MAG: Gfo/Idh/MocA family oxidoreductase [Peptococcaceae bacterium]|nr:Gfo/Idh/MocA family oxidoreductase [Peptococcaceae bacterium]